VLRLRCGYHSSARIEFESSLRLLAGMSDDQWTPVVWMHAAECMIGVALYQEASEVLAESLTMLGCFVPALPGAVPGLVLPGLCMTMDVPAFVCLDISVQGRAEVIKSAQNWP
jgi:hypothetical protein